MATILVIDDDEMIRDLLLHILEHSGFDVCVAANGPAGLQEYQQTQPDLVVADVKPPSRYGLEVIRALRLNHPDARIIALAAYGDSALQIACKVGADCTLPKPFHIAQFMDLVHDLLLTASE
ncbi:MAG: response regulator [bacterium]|nr:response regulator [bacterium]